MPVSVKLVSEVGVGTAAAGCQGHADKVLIGRFHGGTGALRFLHQSMPVCRGNWDWLKRIKRWSSTAPSPDRPGDRRSDEDRAATWPSAALLGAEEYGFATAPLIIEGCIMMRKCHLNTCPVGIATQDPVLRKEISRPAGTCRQFLLLHRRRLRQIMAKLGFRTINEMVGRVDKLKIHKAVEHWKAKGLDLAPLLKMPMSVLTSRGIALLQAGSRHRRDFGSKAHRTMRPAIDRGQRSRSNCRSGI